MGTVDNLRIGQKLKKPNKFTPNVQKNLLTLKNNIMPTNFNLELTQDLWELV